MRKISQKWRVLIAFAIGIVGTQLFNGFSSDPYTANVSSAILDARSEGQISALEAEVNRLRDLLQDLSRRSGIPLSAKDIQGEKRCEAHTDCQSIAAICKDNVCTNLENPACSCGGTGNAQYVLCVSDNGKGDEARTVQCENGCSKNPAPHCK